jgi:hypothetical protein
VLFYRTLFLLRVPHASVEDLAERTLVSGSGRLVVSVDEVQTQNLIENWFKFELGFVTGAYFLNHGENGLKIKLAKLAGLTLGYFLGINDVARNLVTRLNWH